MESKMETITYLFEKDGLAFFKSSSSIMIAHGSSESYNDFNIVLSKNEAILLFVAYITGMPLPMIPGLRAELNESGNSLKLAQTDRFSWMGPVAAKYIVADLLENVN